MKNTVRILVLEPDDALGSTILSALHQAEPDAVVDLARNIDDAHRITISDRPDLFVLDLDAAKDLGHDFLLDLRTSVPNARAIVLSGVHLEPQRQQLAGTGGIHFLEKPLPEAEFITLVQTLVHAPENESGQNFQGTLSDLHLSDIIQLKCMSGATSALEFTGPAGERARVYFEDGQVRHASTPRSEGVDAFNEIVSWKGGKISEVSGAGTPPRTINTDWQFLLMEAVRKVDETSERRAQRKKLAPSQRQRILVIDDSLMLLTFVQEILSEANYDVTVAATAEEGLEAARAQRADLILLDYLLPDLRGDEVSRRLHEDQDTAGIPVLYMSGFGADLASAQAQHPNVLAILNKPFSSDMLLKAVEQHLPKPEGYETADFAERPSEPAFPTEVANVIVPEGEPEMKTAPEPLWHENAVDDEKNSPSHGGITAVPEHRENSTELYFAGDTSFLPLGRALHIISREKLSGVLRCSWSKGDVELYAREGKILLVSTRDADVYCGEAPITLVNVDPERLEQARDAQRRTGAPLFLPLLRDDLILRDPALQLVQHYGQKLFAQLWCAPRVRVAFQSLDPLPDFARETPGEEDVDHWALATLRLIQYPEIADQIECDPSYIPAYTRDGFDRVQKLRLSVAEAQFASQFNGSRSIAQIARNLRLDLKFARLTLFRFLALEIVECWPPQAVEKTERPGVFKRFGRSIGIGE
ncbi:MAG: response regulator [Verrucomicrobia bacterium]|nr:response regulator [Verrucomicrobiota bacterium]